jgi:alpha-methylacyl-CoA racemase
VNAGPLAGIRVVEFAGLGPAPFCAMLLSDLGADVVRIDRPDASTARAAHYYFRGRRSITADLKDAQGVALARRLAGKADALIEGFRPGVMERNGLGPDVLLQDNPRLVYGRVTGWGQTGPLAQAAGHDINYIALSGALAAIGPREAPVPPLNLVGDYGGGALYLALGVLSALWHARATGRGQVVDAAMVDGSISMMSIMYSLRHAGGWTLARESNRLDGGAPYYGTYACSDGRWICIASAEPQFYRLLRDQLGLHDPIFDRQEDRGAWPEQRRRLRAAFMRRTRDEWCALLEGTDVCFAPVLDLDEAPLHPHNVARDAFIDAGGLPQPAPAPRFSLTPGAIQRPPQPPGANTDEVLRDWNL